MCQPVTLAPEFVVLAEAVTLKVKGTVAPLLGLLTVTVTPAAWAEVARSNRAASAKPSTDRMDLGCVCMLKILSRSGGVYSVGGTTYLREPEAGGPVFP
jgi:hypothetical protein